MTCILKEGKHRHTVSIELDAARLSLSGERGKQQPRVFGPAGKIVDYNVFMMQAHTRFQCPLPNSMALLGYDNKNIINLVNV